MRLHSIVALIKTAVSSWIDDFAPSMGAALAYYTVFSVAPLLVIVIAVAALIFGQEAAQDAIMEQARALLGTQSANAIQTMLASAQQPKQGVLASVFSIGALVIGATTVFSELETDLNRIWKIEASKKPGVWGFLRGRVLSFGVILTLGFLLLVSLLISAGLAAWGKYWSGWFGDMHLLLAAANFVVSLVVITALFAVLYKMMPRTHVRWRDVWIGAVVTAAMFMLGKFLIGLYIGKSAIASSYGAGGALVVLLLWVYYSSQIFLIGAEFTHAYAMSHDARERETPERDTHAATASRATGAVDRRPLR
jgi:membrane protein